MLVLVGVLEEGQEKFGHSGEYFQLSGCWEDVCHQCYHFAEKIEVEGVLIIADDPFAHVDVLLELVHIQLAPPACLFFKFLHFSVDALPEELHQHVQLIVLEALHVAGDVGYQLPLGRYCVWCPAEGEVREDQLEVGLTVGGFLKGFLKEFEAVELESWLLGGLSDGVLDEGGEEGLVKKVHYAFEEVVEVVQILSTYPGEKAAAFLQVPPQNIGDEILVDPLLANHHENYSHFLKSQG